MPSSNVRIESTMLNNGVHAIPTAHWEKWKDEGSISNMEAIDNKVYFFLMISLIITRSVQIFHFTILCMMFIVLIIIMYVLKSLLITQTNTFCIIGSWQMLLEKQLECEINSIAPPTSPL